MESIQKEGNTLGNFMRNSSRIVTVLFVMITIIKQLKAFAALYKSIQPNSKLLPDNVQLKCAQLCFRSINEENARNETVFRKQLAVSTKRMPETR